MTTSSRLSSFTLYLFLCGAPLYGFSFLDPIFDTLNRDVLIQKRGESERIQGPLAELELAGIEYFLSEEAYLNDKIHESSRWLESAHSRCEFFEVHDFRNLTPPDAGLALYLCALIEIDFSSNQALDLYFRARDAAVPSEERLYPEGRILSSRESPRFEPARAIIHFLTLKQLKAHLTASDFWIGRTYFLIGNEREARKVWKESPKNMRVTRIFDERGFLRVSLLLKSVSYGITPFVFSAVPFGLGGGVHFFDDRLFDTHRGGYFLIGGSTGGLYFFKGGFEDNATLSSTGLFFHPYVQREPHRFYGFGYTRSNQFDFTALEWGGELRAKQTVFEYFSFELGWRFESWNFMGITSENFASDFPRPTNIYLTGPVGRLEWDKRVAVNPRRGTHLFVEGYFPTEGLGSQASFESWRAGAYYGLGLHSLWDLGGRLQLVSTSHAPYAAIPRLSGEINLPAVGTGRYRDHHILTSSLEARWASPLSGFDVIGFGMAGRLGRELKGILNNPWILGGGVGIEISSVKYREPSARLEIGQFGDDFTFQITAGLLL